MKVNNATPNVIPTIRPKQTSFKGRLTNFEKIPVLKNIGFLDRNGSLTQKLFFINAFAFLLGGRIVTARDNNEKREIITRDIPSILIAVYGITSLEKVFAKQMQKLTGFAIGTKPDKNNFKGRHTLEVAKESQIKDWYILDKNLAGGLNSFSERLSNQGGNLKKIYSRLSDDIKAKISNFSDDNDSFMKELNKNKALSEDVTKAMSETSNKAHIHASFLKTTPKILGLGVTLGLLGIFLPKFNIYLTEKLNSIVKPAEGINKDKK